MAPSYLARKPLNPPKRKRIIIQEEHDYTLHVTIGHAEDIDSETRNPNGDRRIYRVLGWVEPGDGFKTPAAAGLPNPVWDIKGRIYLGKYEPWKYLHIEVLRVGCRSDPGTSTRIAMVGKARIPLPKIDQKITRRFGLVVPSCSGCVAEGHIIMSMEVKRTTLEDMDMFE